MRSKGMIKHCGRFPRRHALRARHLRAHPPGHQAVCGPARRASSRTGSIPISVRGHTDDAPSQRPRWHGQLDPDQRACGPWQRGGAYLVKQGVQGSSAWPPSAWPATRPMAPNTSPQGRGSATTGFQLVFDSRDASPHHDPRKQRARTRTTSSAALSFDLLKQPNEQPEQGGVGHGAQTRTRDAGFNPLGWMFTFSDLVTLLLTFFVMLLSMQKRPSRAEAPKGRFRQCSAEALLRLPGDHHRPEQGGRRAAAFGRIGATAQRRLGRVHQSRSRIWPGRWACPPPPPAGHIRCSLHPGLQGERRGKTGHGDHPGQRPDVRPGPGRSGLPRPQKAVATRWPRRCSGAQQRAQGGGGGPHRRSGKPGTGAAAQRQLDSCLWQRALAVYCIALIHDPGDMDPARLQGGGPGRHPPPGAQRQRQAPRHEPAHRDCAPGTNPGLGSLGEGPWPTTMIWTSTPPSEECGRGKASEEEEVRRQADAHHHHRGWCWCCLRGRLLAGWMVLHGRGLMKRPPTGDQANPD